MAEPFIPKNLLDRVTKVVGYDYDYARAATLRELVKQYAYNHFHIDGDH